LTGRSVLLNALFSLSTIFLFVLYKKKDKRFWAYLLSLLTFSCALLSRESAMAVPVLLLAYLLLFKVKRWSHVIKEGMELAPYLVLTGIYFIVRSAVGVTMMFQPRHWTTFLFDVITFMRSEITFLRLFVAPVDLHFDRLRKIFDSFLDPQIFLTIIFFSVVACGMVLWYKKLSERLLFFIAWFFIALLPVSQIVAAVYAQPGYISAGEHFLYMPSIGIFVLMAMGARALIRKNIQRSFISPGILAFIFSSIIVYFILTTIGQSFIARNTFTMHQQALKHQPRNLRIHRSYAYELLQLRQFPELEEQFRAILQIDPLDVEARIGLGKVLCDLGQLEEGFSEYLKVRQAGKYSEMLRENILLTADILMERYKERLKREPNNRELFVKMSEIWRIKGNEKAAEAYLKKGMP